MRALGTRLARRSSSMKQKADDAHFRHTRHLNTGEYSVKLTKTVFSGYRKVAWVTGYSRGPGVKENTRSRDKPVTNEKL